MIFETILIHAIAFPHIFGFLPIIAGALIGGVAAAGSTLAIAGLGAAASGALLGATAGAVFTGGQKSASAAREQANKANEASERRFWYDVENWNLQKDKIEADHAYAKETVMIRRANERKLADYKDASAAAQYNYDLQIRNARQASNDAQYAKSENIYGVQLDLNQEAARAGKDQERQTLEDIEREATFDASEEALQTILNEGKLRARGIKGRSIGKGVQATLADYGRSMALLSESVSQAGRNSRAVLQEIERDHFSADLTAYAQRMLKPGTEPMPVKPFATPVATFQDPRELGEFDFGAKPVMGAQMSPNAAANQVWGSTISSIAGSALGGFISSDIGVKENLEYIEKSPSGINIYEWNYIGDNQRYRGVIAQDLIAQGKYDAVSEQDNGYLAVDYSQLDVQMTPV